jgi:hypothetical protein
MEILAGHTPIRFIDSVKVIENLSPRGEKPNSERQTRPRKG